MAYSTTAAALNGGYLVRYADLVGCADGKKGLLSAWVEFTGGDGVQQTFVRNNAGFFAFYKYTDNHIYIVGVNAAGSLVLLMKTASTYVAGGRFHISASWDLETAAAHLYVNDFPDLAANPSLYNSPIDYTRPAWGLFGIDAGGALKVNGEVADFYLNIAEYLDLSEEENRRKFISEDQCPVDLGEDGSLPTGNQPAIFLKGPAWSFPTNRGSGGDLLLVGTLQDGETFPEGEPVPPPPPPPSPTGDFFQTNVYRSQTVPVTTGAGTEIREVFKVRLRDLVPGDVLLCVADCEVRNDAGINTEFVTIMTLSEQETLPAYEHIPAGAILIGNINGTNIDPQGHYYQPADVFMKKIEQPMTAPWLIYRVRCRSSAANGSQVCTIMQPGYGELSCKIFPAE